MIRVTDAKLDTVGNTIPGSLVIYSHGDEWFPCLAVTYDGSKVDLLALNFRDEKEHGPRSPLLLEAPDNDKCMSLGKAQFYMPADLGSLRSHSASLGHVILGSTGAAIVGRVQERTGFKRKSWVISTGQCVGVDTAMPFASKWEVGILNAAGAFEKVLSFPFT